MTVELTAFPGVRLPNSLQIDLRSSARDDPATIVGVTLPVDADGRLQFTTAPGDYSTLRFRHPAFEFVPALIRGLTVEEQVPRTFQFSVTPRVHVSGRVVHSVTGAPVPDVAITGELPTEAGRPDVSGRPWAAIDSATTDADGRYTLTLAPGPVSILFDQRGWISTPDSHRVTLDTQTPGRVPDFRVRPLPDVEGIVVDQDGTPVPNAIIHLRGNLMWTLPTVSGQDGRFRVTPPFIPLDPETGDADPHCPIVALHAYKPLAARADLLLNDAEHLQSVRLELAPRDLTFGIEAARAASAQSPVSRPLRRGDPAPELDCQTWFNTDGQRLQITELRDRIVLLDVWATWCGPCHRDFPMVQLARRLYGDHGLTVIGLHDNSVDPQSVRAHVQHQGLDFPIAVDQPDGRNVKQFDAHGRPAYCLIDRSGRVVEFSRSPDRSLRLNLLELIRLHVLRDTE